RLHRVLGGSGLRAISVCAGSAGVIGMWRQSHDLVRAPNPKWHRGEDLLEVDTVAGGEEPERAPLAWLQRRTPKAKHVSLRGELARAGRFTVAHVLDRLFRRSVRNVGGHGDEILHGWLLLNRQDEEFAHLTPH